MAHTVGTSTSAPDARAPRATRSPRPWIRWRRLKPAIAGSARWCDALGLIAVALVIVLLLHLPRPYLAWNTRLVTGVTTRQKVAALTFDDGPHPTFTPQVLDILDRYHVKATFFMIGRQMAKYPSLVRKVKARGHAIGNHTFTHPPDISRCDPRSVTAELDRCEREIRDLTGEDSSLFRPPCGRIDAATFAIAEDRGYHVVQWSVSADNRTAATPEAMAARVLRRLSPGIVILLHDGVTASRTMDVQAAELIVRDLQRQSYRLVTVPELLALSGGPLAHRPIALQASGVCAAAMM